MSCVPFPMLTAQDLSDSSGRPVASYGPYAKTALEDALLLFQLGTCLANLPDNELHQKLAQRAILAMADQIYLEQQYAKAKASPFSSESIGSYSYTKKSQKKVENGEETGVTWFDIAIRTLSVCDTVGGAYMSGGINVFEGDATVIDSGNGYSEVLGPAEKDGYNLPYSGGMSW